MAALKPVTRVRKRDGRVVDFDLEKTFEAIYGAARATSEFGKEEAEKLARSVKRVLNKKFDGFKVPTIEEIQDVVEKVLVKKGWYQTAKAYIVYRHKRAELRRVKLLLGKTTKLINDYIQQSDWRVKENANMAYSLQGLNNHIASSVVARYWLQEIYPPKIAQAHIDADFHLHDLSFLGSYCVGWDLYDLLVEGFKGVPGKIQSRPAKHFRVALGQIVNFLYTMQGEAAGAQALSNFDTLLAPFIAYDQLDYTAVKQSMQEFLYNMNVPTRVGFQSPFTNLTFDLTAPPDLSQQPVIIGGRPQERKYQEFQKEMDMVNRAFGEVMLEGDARGRVFSFPIPTYNVTKDFNWDNPTLEPIFEMSAKYGIPYWANFVNSDMKPSDVRSMCFPATEKIFYKNENRTPRVCYSTVKGVVSNYLQASGRRNISLLLNGQFFKVKKVYRLRNKKGKIIKIILKNGETLRMTDDHPAMVIEKEKLIMKKASLLKKGEEIPVAKKAYQGSLGDFELGRFVGLYIAEGSTTKKGCVYFSFNQKEKQLIGFVKKVAEERLVAPVRISDDPRWQTSQVWIDSRVVVELVKRFCKGQGAREKRLTSKLFGMSHDFRRGALIGIYQGDGYERDMEFHTTNRKLRDMVAHLAASLGICYFKRTNQKNTKGEEKFTSYVLRISTNSYSKLKPYFSSLKSAPSTIFKEYKHFWGIKINKIERLDYHQHVYDFEIEGDKHLFQMANGIITHNCCRLRLRLTELEKRGGGLFGANALTGSIGVVTLNMARIGYLAKSKQSFLNRVGRLMDLAKEALEIKRKVVERFTEKGLYPYSKFYLRGNKERLGSYWGGHFSTIGLNGLNEGLLNLIKKNIGSPSGKKFAEEVLDYMRAKLIDYQKETGNLYNLEATPAEGTSYRLAKIDKKKYPEIIVANEKQVKKGAPPFYTNSSQLPVDFNGDVFRALKLQDPLQCKYTGGCVFHIFLGERLASGQEAKAVIKKVMENFSLPYVSLTPTFRVCPKCGYLG